MKMTFSEGEINAIIRDDSEVETVLPRDYSDILHDTLRNNYHNIKTSITMAPNRITSEFQVRLSNLRPLEYMDSHNYWPSRLGDNFNFVRLVKSILLTQFAARRTCVKINFSISLIILDVEDEFSPITFLWSSRSNNACLDDAFLVESFTTLDRFVDEVVSPFSVENYLLKKLENLEDRYSGELVPLTVNFYITVDTSTIFGARKTYTQRSLSDNECDRVGTCSRENNCLWKALSSVVTMDNDHRPILRRCKRKRVNQRIAKRLKMQFKKWYNRQGFKSDYFAEPITKNGYDSRFFCILESFLHMGIVLVDHMLVTKKRVGFFGLVDTNKKARCLKVKFASKERTAETVYLATDGQNHIRCVTNLPIFAHKFICDSCGKSYRFSCELKRHKCREEKFATSTLQKWIYSLPVNIEKTLSVENRLKSDTKCMHVLVNPIEGGNGFNITMCFSLLGSDILTKSVVAPNMCGVTKIIAKNCTKAALVVLGERMVNNYNLLKKLEVECNAITLKTNPLRVENLLAAKRGLINFLSTFACYIQAGCAENVNTGDVMHSMISTLSEDNDCNSFNVRFGGNVLQGVCVKGSPVKYMNLAEYASVYKSPVAEESHVANWANVMTKFEQHFGLNITALTPGQIGHHLLANTMTTVEKRMFLTSSVMFQRRTFRENVRYGLLSFHGENKVSPLSSEKATIAADFSKYYFSILTDDSKKPNWLTVGIPVRYEERGKDGIFVPEKTRRRKTIANLFLRLMEEVFETQTVSLLQSREIQFDGKPVDGYIEVEGESIVIEFSGCAFHGRDETDVADNAVHNGICHLPKSVIRKNHPEHLGNCEVCKADESKGYCYAKPKLWRMRDGETSDSMHFFHKNRSYRQIYSETKEKNINIEKAGFKLMVVWECTILKYWNRPLSEFFAQWQLNIKDRYANEMLGHMMGQVCVTAFPLSRFPYLTERSIIDSIRQGTLNGFVTITAECGEKTRDILQMVKPFFYRGADGNPVQSFDIEKKCVSTCLLRELVSNKALDFNIIKIHEVFEFTIATTNPFAKLKHPVQNALSIEGSSTFTKVLKCTVNRSIGSLNYNATKHKKSIVMLEDEISHLKTPSSLSHCTRVNSTTVMMHLKNERPVSNSSHLHLGIVATGVAVMIRYICSMRHYLGTTVQRVNTDGLIVLFKKKHFPESLTMYGNLSLPFDAFLRRERVGIEFVTEYVQWKKLYFRHLGFCPDHERQYVEFLLANETCFTSFQCCIDYVNHAAKFAIIVEFTGDYAIFKSVNSLVVFNSVTGAKYVKGTMYQKYEGDMFDD